MTTIPPINSNYGYGEVSPFDDYKDLKKGDKTFSGYNHSTENKKWAEDTSINADRSIWSHIVELPLKMASYFILQSDFKDSPWSTLCFTAKDLAGNFGDMFRNQIYSHKNSKGEYDDNVGAELFADGKSNPDSGFTLPTINNFVQTKLKYLLIPLSFVNHELANDIEWACVKSLDACWWRKMSIDRAFGNGFWKKLYNRMLKSDSEPIENQLTWKSVQESFSTHVSNAKKAWNNENTTEFCDHFDRAISIFTPVIQCLNVAGDIGRPLARRLGIEGTPRNIIRILSAIDRPLIWANNLLRYYFPEVLNKKDSHAPASIADAPHTLLAATIGDMIDFSALIFEDKIKESSGMINHFIEIVKRFTTTANDMYFSARRRRALNDNQSLPS